MTQSGLTINPKKLVAPSTPLVCLGILINTETRTMSVPPDKLDSIIDMCSQWQHKIFCSKRQLQSLLGSLLYVSKYVKRARTFLNRMLMLLRENFEKDTIFLNRAFFKDLNWFHTFLRQFNGVVYYDIKPVQAELHLDASLTGMGEFLTTSVMLCRFPKLFKIAPLFTLKRSIFWWP